MASARRGAFFTLAVAVVAGLSALLTHGFLKASSDSEASRRADAGLIDWLSRTPALSTEARRAILTDRIAQRPDESAALLEVSARQQATTRPTSREVATDLASLDALERSLARVLTVSQADATARAHQALTEQANTKLNAIVARLAEESKQFVGDAGAAVSAAAWTTEVDRVISLSTDVRINQPEVRSVVAGVVSDALTTAQSQVSHSRALHAQLIDRAKENSAIEPVATEQPGALGPCAQEQRRIQEVLALLADDRLHRWARISGDNHEQALLQAESDLATCGDALSRMQSGLYNLWSIRQINAAEDSAQWAEYLGSVERGILHPSVMAMWNLVHDRRFAEVQQREERPRVVRTLLEATPVSLERF